MNVSEVLYKAADLIEERGWATGNCGMAVEGPMCLEGAIAAALGTPTDIYSSPKFADNDLERGQEYYDYSPQLTDSGAYRAVRAHLDRPRGSLYVWNDAKERTAEQVIEALRAAAIIEAAKEVDVRTVTRESVPA